ncbi:hypothetical protein LDENG_00226090, partial [Lucifuga dentata]
ASSSVGNIVLISIDRYVAICDPLHYITKVTLPRTKSVCTCCVFYNGAILNDFLRKPDKYNSCIGECVLIINYITGTVDFVFTFIAPISVIMVLYMRVFMVAVSQARAMRSHVAASTLQHSKSVTASTHQHSKTVTAKKSELKAATSLGVVVAVFLICFCPFYSPALAGQDFEDNNSFSSFLVWLLYCNSCLNPVIYAFFYPWFRKAIKLIVTFQILQPDSCKAKIL